MFELVTSTWCLVLALCGVFFSLVREAWTFLVKRSIPPSKYIYKNLPQLRKHYEYHMQEICSTDEIRRSKRFPNDPASSTHIPISMSRSKQHELEFFLEYCLSHPNHVQEVTSTLLSQIPCLPPPIQDCVLQYLKRQVLLCVWIEPWSRVPECEDLPMNLYRRVSIWIYTSCGGYHLETMNPELLATLHTLYSKHPQLFVGRCFLPPPIPPSLMVEDDDDFLDHEERKALREAKEDLFEQFDWQQILGYVETHTTAETRGSCFKCSL
jgi:hypothetical protein